MNEILRLAMEQARKTMNENIGGPFGAAVIAENGEILAVTSNSVLRDNDPTAHAEVNAIRAACKKAGSYDLSGCVLYTTAYPCPMCLSAIIWANIKTVYYGCTKKDAGEIGFRDDVIYDYLKGKNTKLISLKEMDREECMKTFEEYKKNNGVIY